MCQRGVGLPTFTYFVKQLELQLPSLGVTTITVHSTIINAFGLRRDFLGSEVINLPILSQEFKNIETAVNSCGRCDHMLYCI